MSKRAEQLQREYVANMSEGATVNIKILPKKIKNAPVKKYGSCTYWIYILRNKWLFVIKPTTALPINIELDMEQINQIKYGQNIYLYGK